VFDKLLGELDAVARQAVDLANMPNGTGPLRLSKGRIRQLLDCERHMIAMLDAPDEPPRVELVLGVLLDALVRHHVTTGRLDNPPLELAMALLRARSDPTAQRVLTWIDDLDTVTRSALGADLAEDREKLLSEWPTLDAGWWPRVQDRASLSLADGEVLIEGSVDIALGGPPTDRRSVLIETKRRALRQEDMEDAMLYALIVALRDRVAPDCAVTCCAQTSALDEIWIGEDELRSATIRLSDVLLIAGELAGDRPPREVRNPRCGWCPAAEVCPTFSAEESGRAPDIADFDRMQDDEPF